MGGLFNSKKVEREKPCWKSRGAFHFHKQKKETTRCDDFIDDLDGDFADDPGDFGEDWFCDDDFEDNEPGDDGDTAPPSGDRSWDGLQWQDWMIVGPLSEEIAREKRERDRIRREIEEDEDDYWTIIGEKW